MSGLDIFIPFDSAIILLQLKIDFFQQQHALKQM
jgi:hypothetical protein